MCWIPWFKKQRSFLWTCCRTLCFDGPHCSLLPTRTWWKELFTEDTTHFGRSTKRKRVGQCWKAFSLLTSFHGSRRCCAGCWRRLPSHPLTDAANTSCCLPSSLLLISPPCSLLLYEWHWKEWWVRMHHVVMLTHHQTRTSSCMSGILFDTLLVSIENSSVMWGFFPLIQVV